MKLRREGSAGLGAAIREKRHGVGKTLTEIAELTGISQSYLSQIERGEVTNPTIEVLFRILLALGENLLLEVRQPEDALSNGDRTVYHSPFALDDLAGTEEEYSGQQVVRLVGEVLKDVRIPVDQRQLLGRQIESLARITREAIADESKTRRKDDPVQR